MRKSLILLLLLPVLGYSQTVHSWTTFGVKTNTGNPFGSGLVVAGDTIKLMNDIVGHSPNWNRFENFHGSEGSHIVIDQNGFDIDVSDATVGGNPGGASCISFGDSGNNSFITLLANEGELIAQTGAGYCVFARAGHSWLFDGLIMTAGSQSFAFHNDRALGQDYLDYYHDYPNGISTDYITIRNCVATGASNENYYLGNSNSEKGYTLTTDRDFFYTQSVIGRVDFYNNESHDAGNEGIQISSDTMYVHDNKVRGHGINGSTSHDNGIQASGTGIAFVWNNDIDGETPNGVGINIFASEGYVWNNKIQNVRSAGKITFLQGKHNGGIWFVHNTMINVSERVIDNYNPVNKIYVWNNIRHLTTPPSGNNPAYYYAGVGLGVSVDERGNIDTHSAAGLAALDLDANLEPNSGSSAEGVGVREYRNIKYEFVRDFNGNRRSPRIPITAGAIK